MPRVIRNGEIWIVTDTEPDKTLYNSHGSLRLRTKNEKQRKKDSKMGSPRLSYRRWTEKQITLLRTLAKTESKRDIAHRIQKSEDAVRRKAHDLGIRLEHE